MHVISYKNYIIPLEINQDANFMKINWCGKRKGTTSVVQKIQEFRWKRIFACLTLTIKLGALCAAYAHTDSVGILPGEEMERAYSTTSVISRDYIPSGNTHIQNAKRFEWVDLDGSTNDRKRKRTRTGICSVWRASHREGRSNVSNPILKIADFQSGSIPTESPKRKTTQSRIGLGCFWWPVRESNPCFQRERLTS